MTNWLAPNPFEPWEVSQQRLQALVVAEQDPTEEEVGEALRPIGLSTTLVAHEASRVLSLSGGGSRAVLKEAALPGKFYDAVEIVRSLRRRRAKGAARSGRSRRLVAKLTAEDRSHLDYLKGVEKRNLEEARRFEHALGKGNWRAKVHRRAAQEATRHRKAFEQKVLDR